MVSMYPLKQVGHLYHFERFYVVNNGYINEIYFSAGYVPINGTKFALMQK